MRHGRTSAGDGAAAAARPRRGRRRGRWSRPGPARRRAGRPGRPGAGRTTTRRPLRPARGRARRGRVRRRRGPGRPGSGSEAADLVEPAQQLELLGAGQDPAPGRLPRPVQSRQGVVPPSRRWADPAPGAASRRGCARRLGGHRAAGACSACVRIRLTSWRFGVGARGGLAGHRGEGVERGVELGLRPDTWSGSCQPCVLGGRTGRRSSRSPTTSTPLPLDPLDPPLGLLLGPGVALGREPHRRPSRA